jgi:hypothetical protein
MRPVKTFAIFPPTAYHVWMRAWEERLKETGVAVVGRIFRPLFYFAVAVGIYVCLLGDINWSTPLAELTLLQFGGMIVAIAAYWVLIKAFWNFESVDYWLWAAMGQVVVSGALLYVIFAHPRELDLLLSDFLNTPAGAWISVAIAAGVVGYLLWSFVSDARRSWQSGTLQRSFKEFVTNLPRAMVIAGACIVGLFALFWFIPWVLGA